MPRRPLGGSGLLVSAVGWSAGALARPPGPATPATLVRAALDAQIDLFDAPPDGDGQEALARALGSKRRAVTLGARCAASEGPAAFSPPGREWRPEEVRRRLEAALRRLQTDWLELWTLDRPPADAVADDNLWAQLADDRQAGWIRAVGMALDTEDDARAALGQGALDVLALRLHLGQADPGRSLAAEAAERQVAVVADDPLDSGVTGTRLVRGLTSPDTERSEAQAELAGVLSLAGVTTVLSPAALPAEIEAHAAAAAMPLSDVEARELVARLDEARESQREP
jgi:aryl-alcohol dehydrogenase-like predicted oxidoreductase